MAQLAARVNCSLRTLYALAPRKDALLLMVIDRRLHRIGRAAMAAIAAGHGRARRRCAPISRRPRSRWRRPPRRSRASSPTVPGARAAHRCARQLRHRGDRAAARARGRRGPDRAGRHGRARARAGRPRRSSSRARSVLPRLEASPKATADAILAIVLRGLGASSAQSSPARAPPPRHSASGFQRRYRPRSAR